jgi:hypothetical protein
MSGPNPNPEPNPIPVDTFDAPDAFAGSSFEERQSAIEAQLAKLEAERVAPVPKTNENLDPFADDPVVQRVDKVAETVKKLEGTVENINATFNEARREHALSNFKAATVAEVRRRAEADPVLSSNPEAVSVMLEEMVEMIDGTFDTRVPVQRQFAVALQSAKTWRNRWATAIDRRAKGEPPPTKEDKRQLAEKLDHQERASTTVSGSAPPTVTDRTKRPRTPGEILAALKNSASRQPAGV